MSWQYMFNAINNTPDIYLDELQMELKDVLGVTVDKSMIWCGLRRGGYTMKQVCTRLIYIYISADITPANSPLSKVLRNGWNLWHVLEHMKPSNLYLLTRVQLTTVQHTEEEHGQYVATKQFGRHSLYMGNSE